MNINLSTFVTQDSEISGTSLQGYLSATYDELKSKLGEPSLDPLEKTGAMWTLRLGDTVITIYDSVPEGFGNNVPQGDKPHQWHIGGVKPGVVGIVAALLHKNINDSLDRPLVGA